MNGEAAAVPRGRLYVIAAPSGAGKTSLVRGLLERIPSLSFSVSYTTRRQRASEVQGKDYHFVGDEEFQRMIDGGEFLEHATVFGNRYGTSKPDVVDLLDAGRSVLLEIDWQGARQVRRQLPQAVGIFVLPPSVAELERRLRGRATDAERVIQRRLAEAREDMHHWTEFDFVIINDQFDDALDALASIVAGGGGAHSTRSAPLRARIVRLIESAGSDSA